MVLPDSEPILVAPAAVPAADASREAAAAKLIPQIMDMMARFPEPTAFSVCRDDSGALKTCCVAATAFYEGAVMAASARHGVAGVLDVMQTKFKWGTARCWTLCDSLKQTEVDCGTGMNAALVALRLAPSVADGTTRIAKVQFVQRWPTWQGEQRRSLYTGVAEEDREFLTCWIGEDVVYHQCVGLVNSDGTALLRIWDYGSWHLPPTNFEAERAIVAIKVRAPSR